MRLSHGARRGLLRARWAGAGGAGALIFPKPGAFARWLRLLCLLFLTVPSLVPSDGAGPHHALPPGVQRLLLPGAERAADLRSRPAVSAQPRADGDETIGVLSAGPPHCQNCCAEVWRAGGASTAGCHPEGGRGTSCTADPPAGSDGWQMPLGWRKGARGQLVRRVSVILLPPGTKCPWKWCSWPRAPAA